MPLQIAESCLERLPEASTYPGGKEAIERLRAEVLHTLQACSVASASSKLPEKMSTCEQWPPSRLAHPVAYSEEREKPMQMASETGGWI